MFDKNETERLILLIEEGYIIYDYERFEHKEWSVKHYAVWRSAVKEVLGEGLIEETFNHF